jgi:hypothetical protein
MVNKFRVGQNVLLAKREGNKMSSVFENKLYKVIRQKGSNLLVKSENGQAFYRNVSHESLLSLLKCLYQYLVIFIKIFKLDLYFINIQVFLLITQQRQIHV